MLFWLPQILTPSEREQIVGVLRSGQFQDGKASAGNLGRNQKANEELDFRFPAKAELDRLVMAALARNQTLDAAARPKTITRPVYSRYGVGMHYGMHMDNAVMGRQDRMRIDLSMTIFLSDPDSYDGGELSLETEFGTKTAKLPAGDAVLYPTIYYHEVKPILRGERLAAVLWIQSLVKDPHQRNLLYELSQAADTRNREAPDAPETKQLIKIHMNLLRMWAEN